MNWNEVRLKRIARFRYGDAFTEAENGQGSTKVFGSNGPFATSSRSNTRAPAIIIGRKGSYGKINWSPEVCFASDTTFFVDSTLTQQKLRWLFYVLQTLRLDEGSAESAVPGLNREDAYEKLVFLPSVEEQLAIADYLDREAFRIDALIAAKERLLELLAEKRRALITQAVTKGLNPNAPMRDSGLPWLGEIPGHWEVTRMKWIARLQGGYAFNSSEFTDEGIPVVRMNNLKRGRLDFSDCKRIPESAALEEFSLQTGDLLIGMSGSIGETVSLGNFAKVTERDVPAQLNQRVGRFKADNEKIDQEFLEAIVESSLFAEQVLLFVTGTAQFNISSEQVESIIVALPPLNEQKAICEHIRTSIERLENLREATNETILLLRERRAALIAAAVTGKLHVPTNAGTVENVVETL